MRIAIVNIGAIVSGDLDHPLVAGDTIVTEDTRIVSVGTAPAAAVETCDLVIDADRTTAIPGLIDSHVHITFGDYTPRQQTVGYLESYLHGGVTTAISASPSNTLAAMSGSTMVSPSPMTALGDFMKALIGAGSGSVPSSM